MEKLLLSPPIAFVTYFVFIVLFSMLLSRCAFRPGRRENGDGGTKAYACGEDTYNQSAQPDYSYFFHFAFFFTMAHVAAMMITMVPAVALRTLQVALLYVTGIIAGFAIVLRK